MKFIDMQMRVVYTISAQINNIHINIIQRMKIKMYINYTKFER